MLPRHQGYREGVADGAAHEKDSRDEQLEDRRFERTRTPASRAESCGRDDGKHRSQHQMWSGKTGKVRKKAASCWSHRSSEAHNGLRFSGFGPRADCADILSRRRAEVRCNRELDAGRRRTKRANGRDGDIFFGTPIGRCADVRGVNQCVAGR
jgi:hypothetical protein